MKTYTITIRVWDTEREPEEVLEHVTTLAAQGYTSGHDMGLYWEIKEGEAASEKEGGAA